jgi:hypothetical protein
MNLQVIKIRVLRWAKRLFLFGGYTVLILLFSGFLILQIPATQQNILDRLLSRLSRASGFTITYDDFFVWWFDRVEISGVRITDPEQNTMIEAGDLRVNFRLSSVYGSNTVNLDAVTLTNAHVYITPIQDTDSSRNLNINVWISRLQGSGGGGGQSPVINISEIQLEDSRFSLNNTSQDSLRSGFDYHHFSLDVDAGLIRSFKVVRDTTQFILRSLAVKHAPTGLHIRQLSTFFRICRSAMEFNNLRLQTQESYISDTIRFLYQSQADLSNFVDRVNIVAHLDSTVIAPRDLALFAPLKLPAPLELHGSWKGRIKRFSFNRMRAKLANSRLVGDLSFDGLPSISETFMNINVRESEVDFRDLRFVLSEAAYKRISRLGTYRMQGRFTGFTNDFVANGTFNGPTGFIKSDINLKLNAQDLERSAYRGRLQLVNFDLGSFLNDTTTFKRVTMQGEIAGTGFSKEAADFRLNGEIRSVGILNYTYQNISTNAHLALEQFNGRLVIDDPNLKFSATGEVDLRPNSQRVNIAARLDTIRLKPLGLSRDDITIQSTLDADTRGLQLDSITGNVYLRDVRLQLGQQQLALDSIRIQSQHQNLTRSLQLNSSLINAGITGTFRPSEIFRDGRQLVDEFLLNLRNNPVEIQDYYRSKAKTNREYRASFTADIVDLNPLLKIVAPQLFLSRDFSLEGQFIKGYTSRFSAYCRFDSLVINQQVFRDNEIDFSGSKISDSTTVLASLVIQSGSQKISKKLSTQNLFFEAVWNRTHMEVTLDANQVNSTNYARLESEIDFQRDSTRIFMLPSRLFLLDKLWQFKPGNYILNAGREWQFHDVALVHAGESLTIDGLLSYRDPEAALRLIAKDFDLSIVNGLTTEKFAGTLRGQVTGKNLYREPFVQNDVSIEALHINDFLIGDVTGLNQWNPEADQFDIQFNIDRLGARTVDIAGFYQPKLTESPLNLHIDLRKTSLRMIEPIVRDIFSRLDGQVSGEYTVRGTFGEPQIRGQSVVENGSVTIDYLKTSYTFNGRLLMTPNQITFKDFALVDAFRNQGYLDGFLGHRNFSRFRVNLDANFTNFQVLNTTNKDNSLFYGQAFGTGRLNIFGPFNNLKISATARTEKNSRIFIPVTDSENTEKKEFISFVHFADSAKLRENRQKKKKKTEESSGGLTMDLNLDITPDAYAEIIFDVKAGDIIRGYGRGDIQLQINTRGEFNMFGVYEFDRGFYNFTLYNIINKEFSINKGSRISWYGDPYAGLLSLVASYRQTTSLAPIVSNQTVANSPGLRRKYPIEVMLKLDGPMLSPQIGFDIAARDLPRNVVVDEQGTTVNLEFEFDAFKSKLDEQELKRQVFSLIILRRFSPIGESINTSGSVYNSVSELLSNQLSNFLTQVDSNLEIDLDLGTLDQEAFNTFQLRLSYSFLNGRLRVTREGTLGGDQSQQSAANLIGEWTVDYVLTPDGKFRVKMYSRNNFNNLNNTLGNPSQTAVTTGFSLSHTQSFNQIKDLLTSARERRRKELQNQPPPDEDKVPDDGSR